MSINELKPLLDDNQIDQSYNKEQLDTFYQVFRNDFIENPFKVEGKTVKIITNPSKIKEYSEYSETFVHLVTRGTNSGIRYFEAERANRIHWIKQILVSVPSPSVKYYRWKDANGECKHHYWHFSSDFMIVLKDISSDTRIVTTFCVDKDERPKFYERLSNFQGGLDCLKKKQHPVGAERKYGFAWPIQLPFG